MKNFVFFTDLDGTLLDYSTYSFEKAVPALKRLKDEGLPLVICSSKTRAEIEYYRKKLGNRHPFISENGGGIFIPKGYFDFALQDAANSGVTEEEGYDVIVLGARYSDLREAVLSLIEERFDILGFGDMTAGEVAELSGLTVFEAELSKQRDFDEPFLFQGNKDEDKALMDAIREKGFTCTRGRFFHILGDSNKGTAVSVLAGLYRKQRGDIVTVGLGDRPNDFPMLETVDIPVLVRQPDERYAEVLNIAGLVKADGIGPEGWNKTVLDILAGAVRAPEPQKRGAQR
ncbi:MAG: HAD-IIB family hydrolase [Nitrospiraceae bacterium]|nr:HAD-IIB family hydrolase [Nitrospiraceae bacterium]